jgi:uncharacterized membrane protein SpoIIM required for sporulation
MYRYQRTLLFSFIFFIAFTVLGIVASLMEPDFVKMILGAEYVEMTEQNIANNDPFGVYKSGDSFLMFLMIAGHNIKLSLISFASGMLFGFGTLYFLFVNGIMFGTFEHMFAQHHLGIQFFLVVFIHGTLELSALVVESCAGFVLGTALLFPGTFTRLQALKYAAKDAVKIIISLVPIFMIAAFFESYVTRHTEMPLALSLLILLGSLGFILFYFVVLPHLVFRKAKLDILEKAK